jgi:drug/metabolite transporter (DMT)-like permease
VRWRPAVVLAIVAGALLATALAFYLQTWAQRYVSPTRAALIFTLEPVFAWVVAWWWTGELFTPRAGAGAALILAGVLIVELKPNRRAAHPLEK